MPTTITKSIGSGGGRDYSTPQTWENAITIGMVAADEAWVGEAYNDSEFTAASTLERHQYPAGHVYRPCSVKQRKSS